jgi:hypothetical protein
MDHIEFSVDNPEAGIYPEEPNQNLRKQPVIAVFLPDMSQFMPINPISRFIMAGYIRSPEEHVKESKGRLRQFGIDYTDSVNVFR